MSEATLTLEPETVLTEPPTNEHDVAVAEVEAAAEIAVAEINADAREAEAERIADAIADGAEQTEEEQIQWLKERVAFLEGQQASPPTILIAEEAETPNPSTPQASEEAETMDPMEAAELDPTISTPPSTSEETNETPTEAILESEVVVAVEEAPARPRRRRILI